MYHPSLWNVRTVCFVHQPATCFVRTSEVEWEVTATWWSTEWSNDNEDGSSWPVPWLLGMGPGLLVKVYVGNEISYSIMVNVGKIYHTWMLWGLSCFSSQGCSPVVKWMWDRWFFFGPCSDEFVRKTTCHVEILLTDCLSLRIQTLPDNS